jgi:hypothetical protein
MHERLGEKGNCGNTSNDVRPPLTRSETNAPVAGTGLLSQSVSIPSIVQYLQSRSVTWLATFSAIMRHPSYFSS